MAFRFIPRACPIYKLKFFQQTSHYSRFNKAVVKYHFSFFARPHFASNGPQNPSGKFFGLDIGHYGLYYSIFNRDGQKVDTINILQFNPIWINPLEIKFFENFFINDLNAGIYNDIENLKSRFTTPLVFKRNLSTRRNTGKLTVEPILKDPRVIEGIEDFKAPVQDDFEDTFLGSQIQLIEEHFDQQKLELIYPIYQAITRNHLSLPTTELYNKVLKSLVFRNLNSQNKLEDIEIKLTNVLTVYQDFLKNSSPDLKPDNETFNLVINELMDGSLKVLSIRDSTNLPNLIYNESFIKVQEFLLISMELMFSIDIKKLNLDLIYPKMFKLLNNYPNLINNDILSLIFNNLIKNSSQFEYYNELIKLSKHFQKFEILASNKQCYDFILHIYNQFKENNELIGLNTIKNYEIYNTMIMELCETKNINVATKFLNDILNEYSHNYTNLTEVKGQISEILSNYLTKISNENVNKAIELTNDFKAVNYLPELTMSYYNHIIGLLVQNYYQSTNEVDLYNIYKQIWSIVDYNLIRKDFKLSSSLISFALNLNDHDNIFKLTKVIILNDELIDPITFKNLLSYYREQPSVLTNLIEHQAKYYSDFEKLNDYLCDVVNFINTPNMFNYLVNSFMIRDAFTLVDLTKDKIYGIVQVSKYFVNYIENNEVTIEDLTKVLNLQAMLIEQFEDPELIYINLDEDLSMFKNKLIENFKQNVGKLNGSTSSIQNISRIYDIPVETKKANVTPIVDLSVLININNHSGVQKFVELFDKGFKFNDLTYSMVINKKMTLENLNWDRFIELIKHNEQLVLQLISQGNDNITVKTINKVNITKSVYEELLKTVSNSDNVYLYEKFKTINHESSDEQLVRKAKLMIKFNDFNELNQLITSNPHIKGEVQQLIRSDVSTGLIKFLEDDEKLMQFYSIHKKSVNQQKLISDLLTRLTTLGNVRLEKLIHGLKVIKLNYFSVDNFIRFIKLLTSTNQQSMLSILLQKVINLGNIGGLIKFNGLEILVKSQDTARLINELKQSFTALNCEINLLKIEINQPCT
ncbi:hypothetical protein CLIB1444_08S01772 [[Candida] jaroonii]|uniref:Uncharacterized protein n=1 Tax=[Candida] jaroonii TaxID=467808 RepID=A0ACA9YAK4_9ASCO|nr:hypothetical protein CLIB1444_08S01772 [[Candida] jaroonii]